jgi:hypothetical protein
LPGFFLGPVRAVHCRAPLMNEPFRLEIDMRQFFQACGLG